MCHSFFLKHKQYNVVQFWLKYVLILDFSQLFMLFDFLMGLKDLPVSYIDQHQGIH